MEIVWKDIVSGYSRFGVDWKASESNTSVTYAPTMYLWYLNNSQDSYISYSWNLNADGTSVSSGSDVVEDYTIYNGGTYHEFANAFSSRTITKGHSTKTLKLDLSFGDLYGGYGQNWTGSWSGTWTYTVPALASYTVSYNANGGSGAPSKQTKWYGESLTLSSTKPTRTGYTFTGWALSKSEADSGTWYYAAGGSCGKNENLTLYATWTEHVLTVNYYSNYATESFADALNTVDANKNVLVHSQSIYYDNDYSTYGLANYSNSTGSVYMKRIGYTGTGNWGTSTSGGTLINENTGFATGQALAQALGKTLASGDASVNVYPQWRINTYTINYNANGGYGNMNSQTVQWNELFTLSNNTFKREGYKFIGWNARRNIDNTYYVVGQGWLTEDVILANGYEKKLYGNQDELTFNNSWVSGNEYSISQYTLYAIWEISGVVYIDNGTEFEPYLAYIDNGTEWELYLVYIDDGATWHIIS